MCITCILSVYGSQSRHQSPGTRVIDSLRASQWVLELNWVLCKSDTCYLPLGHILSPNFLLEFGTVLCYILFVWPCYNVHARQAGSMPAVLTAEAQSST